MYDNDATITIVPNSTANHLMPGRPKEARSSDKLSIPNEIVVKKPRFTKCPGVPQGTKKWNELQSSQDVVDLTLEEELTPLNFDHEEAKLAKSLDCLKKRNSKCGFLM